MARNYTAADGITTPDLLHFGFDHLSAAETLLKGGNARHFDSGGYVAHMAFELLLKAWQFHIFGVVRSIHNLNDLWNIVRQNGTRQLSRRDLGTLQILDRYETLRYPNLNSPTEIGDDDASRIGALSKALLKRMPKSLRAVIATLDWSTKGGRVLMQKPHATSRLRRP